MRPWHPALVFSIAALAAACIDRPEARAPDASGDVEAELDSDSGVGSEVDTGVEVDVDAGTEVEAGPVDVPTPDPVGAFPPEGVTMNVRALEKVDFNGDGVDDLVVRNYPNDPDSYGFAVLLGGEDFGQLHAWVPTPLASPGGIHFDDVVGDERPDVLIFGSRQGQAYLLIYPWVGGEALFGEPLTRQIMGSAGDAGDPLNNQTPVFVTTVEIDGEAPKDVVVGDLQQTRLLTLEGWTQQDLDQAIELPLYPNSGEQYWGLTIDVLATPSATGGFDDLLLLDEGLSHWWPNDGGVLASSAQTFGTTAMRGHSFVDMDGDEATDVLVWKAAYVALLQLVAPDQGGPSATERLFQGEVPIYVEFSSGDAGQLDDDARPDIALTERAGNEPIPNHLTVLQNVFIDGEGSFRSPVSPIDKNLPDPQPVAVIVGDFDADQVGEVRVFAADGSHRCFHLVANPLPALDACP